MILAATVEQLWKGMRPNLKPSVLPGGEMEGIYREVNSKQELLGLLGVLGTRLWTLFI